MHTKSAIIISPMPLKPVKSGMQNTIYLLYKYLKNKNYKVSFYEIKTNNIIDPVLNLGFKNSLAKQIKKGLNYVKQI